MVLRKKRVWHFWSENVLGRSQRNFKNRVIPSPVALSLPLRLAELSGRLNSPSASDLHSASQREYARSHRDATLQLQTPAFRVMTLGSTFLQSENTVKRKGLSGHDKPIVVVYHLAPVSCDKRKWWSDLTLATSSLSRFYFALEGALLAHLALALGGDRMTIIYFDTQENVVIGEKTEAYCEEDPHPCLSHKYHFSATGK